MATSTIPAAIDALLAAVTAAADGTTKVIDGFPRFKIVNTDFIAVGGKAEQTASGEQAAGPLSSGRKRDESYRLRVYCSSSRGSDNQKAVRDRAFELMAVVENVLRDDVTLGGVVRTAQVAGGIDLFQTDAETAGDGVFAEVDFDVDVQARI